MINRLFKQIFCAVFWLSLTLVSCESTIEAPHAVEINESTIFEEDNQKLGLIFYSASGKKKVISASSGLMKWATSNHSWGISGKKTEYDYVHATITTRNDYKENSDKFRQ